MTVIYEATEDRPHFCTTANASLPVGSICRCDCGRFWLRKTVIGDCWVYRWVPVRWYHRKARRRIKDWVRQKNNGDFRFPMTSLLTAAPAHTAGTSMERPTPMTDLRTRIAAVLNANLPVMEFLRPGDTEYAADAVIRELGLRREVDDRASFRMEPSRARYVTEWNTDE